MKLPCLRYNRIMNEYQHANKLQHHKLNNMSVKVIHLTPFSDQKPGTSGLRRKVLIFQQDHYIESFAQSTFNAIGEEAVKNGSYLISGDGRFYTKEAIYRICCVAAGNNVRRIIIGLNGYVSTPAASAIIRNYSCGNCNGAFILTASHNPGGPDGDFGIKFNTENGSPATEILTNKIYEMSKSLCSYQKIDLPHFDISKIGVQEIIPNRLTIDVVDPADIWVNLLKRIFDFKSIQSFIKKKQFKFIFDGLNGVAGIYAKRLFWDEMNLRNEVQLIHCEPLEDFGGLHPDPNLVYARELVDIMKVFNTQEVDSNTPDFAAAGDGDNDRNMILGKGFFLTPSDSLALITLHATECIPYFNKGLKGVSRSMPTSSAVDHVAADLKLDIFETPTGWKFFSNLLDAGKISICGEESFGTGSDHIREKDGLWAVLSWLSILAYHNLSYPKYTITLENIVKKFWMKYGRNYFLRYDFEDIDDEKADHLMNYMINLCSNKELMNNLDSSVQEYIKSHPIAQINNFEYLDPVDFSISSNQGICCIFTDGSRIVWRLSGTGSSKATIRIYLDKFEKTKIDEDTDQVMKDFSWFAIQLCKMKEFTGKASPSLIT